MPMLPGSIRYKLFDSLSRKTMRYVTALPRSRSGELGRKVYDQIQRDFFINGSLSSRSRVPELFAAVWCLGRETVLVDDKLDKLTKEAMVATLSDVNDCPYCGEMLISLVHAGDEHATADAILAGNEASAGDQLLSARLRWVREVATPGAGGQLPAPFSDEELPEALAALFALSDINRFSHVVMNGSPVKVPFGSRALKSFALRRFAGELTPTQRYRVEPALALTLLPAAELPADMQWAAGHRRVAEALARSAAVTEKESDRLINAETKSFVKLNLASWKGELMPLSRSWVEEEIRGLDGENAAIARLALLLAKASYQIDEDVVLQVCNEHGEEDFIRILAWCSFTAARFQITNIVNRSAPAAAIAA